MFVLIVPPHLDKGSGTIISQPPVALIRCGQDYEAESIAGIIIAQIRCPEFNGTGTRVTAYKDGVEISLPVQFGPVPPPSDDIFGTYTFVSENKCGRDVAVTRIIPKGLCLWHNMNVLCQYILLACDMFR